MASFNLTNILFFCFLICFKIADFTLGTSVLTSQNIRSSSQVSVSLTENSASTSKFISEIGSLQQHTANPSSILDQSKIKIFYQDPSDASKTVECDPPKCKPKIQGNVIDYEIKNGSNCIKVNYDDKEVWKYDSSAGTDGYPESVVAFLDTKTIFVDLKNKLNVLKHDNNQWKSIFTGTPKPICVNMDTKESNGLANYTSAGKVHTHSPKVPNVFKSVKQGDTQIWNTKDFTEYAIKVVYDEIFSDKLFLTVYHVNGIITTFEKPKSDPWKKSEVKPPNTQTTPDKAQTLDEDKTSDSQVSKPKKVAEQSTTETQVSLTQSSKAPEQPKPKDSDKQASMTPVSVTQSSKAPEQPEPKDSDKQASMTPVSVTQSCKVKKTQHLAVIGGLSGFDIINPDSEMLETPKVVETSKTEAKQGRRVASAVSGKSQARKIQVHLDLMTRNETEKFYYSQSFGFWTYTAKNGYYFRSVKDGDNEVWRGISYGTSALKVVAELNSYSYLVGLTLHLVNNHIKRFVKLGHYWTEKVEIS